MIQSQYRIVFRILHQSLDLSDAFRIFNSMEGVKSSDLWIAGKPHINSEGKITDSTSKFSRCIFRFPDEIMQDDANSASPATTLHKLLEQLETQKVTLRELVNLGARLDVWISWRIYSNSGEVFEPKLLKKMSDLDLSLSLDLYATEHDEQSN
jgi:hypothetical protein